MNSDKNAESSSGEATCQSGPVFGGDVRAMCMETGVDAVATSLMEVNSWGRRMGDGKDLKKPFSARKKRGKRGKAGLRLPRRRSSSRRSNVEDVWESSASEGGGMAGPAEGLATAGRATSERSRPRSKTNSMVVRIKLSKSFYRRMFKKNGMQSLCSYCRETGGGGSGLAGNEEDGHSVISSTDWGHGLLSADGSQLSVKTIPNGSVGSIATHSSTSFDSSVEMRSAAPHDTDNVGAALGPVDRRAITEGGCDGSRGMDAASFSYDQLEVRPSRIHGLGIFTRSWIPEGCLVMRYEGEIIGKCTSDRRERNYLKNNIKSIYMFKVDDDTVIDATFVGNKARYINHSCDPNCFSITDAAGRSIVYYSMRVIEPGEELSIDYHFAEVHPGEVCCCGSAACRSKKNT